MPKGIPRTNKVEEVDTGVTVEKPIVEEAVESVQEKPKEPEKIEIEEPKTPTIEVSVEGSVVRTKVYPQIRVGVCEFHGSPYGNVDMTTLKGKCSHVCKTDPLCPHSRTGCPKTPIYEIRDGQEIQTGWDEHCRHEHNYKGLPIRCTYCPKDANMREIIKNRTLFVYGHPEHPNQLIVCCSDFRCVSKHQKRFSRSVI